MTKNQCRRLKTTLIYYPERNRKVQYMIQYICAIYVHNKGDGLCQLNGLHNGLIIQHAHSVDGQTLQQCVQNVEKPLFLGLPPCPRNSYGHWDRNQGARTPAKGIHPLPTHAWSRDPVNLPTLGPRQADTAVWDRTGIRTYILLSQMILSTVNVLGICHSML